MISGNLSENASDASRSGPSQATRSTHTNLTAPGHVCLHETHVEKQPKGDMSIFPVKPFYVKPDLFWLMILESNSPSKHA